MKLTYIVAISSILAACGGGGGGSAPSPTGNVDIAKHTVDGASAAAADIPPSLADTKKFDGGFVSIDGEPAGYLAGTSPRNLAEQIGAFVAADPTKWAVPYRLMLSDAGLRVSVAGGKTGNSSINNAPIYSAASVFIVKLTANGVVVTQV